MRKMRQIAEDGLAFVTMGKKGKRAGKGGGTAKHGAGKARRERALAVREIGAAIIALIERLEKELQNVDVFSPLSEKEDCPVCFLPMPCSGSSGYIPCCGKTICKGCIIHQKERASPENAACPFCRTVYTTEEEVALRQLQKRAAEGDVHSIINLACAYDVGNFQCLKPDAVQARRLFLQAADLGSPLGIYRVAGLVLTGEGGAKSVELAMRLYTAAAKLGCVQAHFSLGSIFIEGEAFDKGLRHLAYAAENGHRKCIDLLTKHNVMEAVWLDDARFAEIEDAYDEATKDEWSEQRDHANCTPRRRIREKDGTLLRLAGVLPDGKKLYA